MGFSFLPKKHYDTWSGMGGTKPVILQSEIYHSHRRCSVMKSVPPPLPTPRLLPKSSWVASRCNMSMTPCSLQTRCVCVEDATLYQIHRVHSHLAERPRTVKILFLNHSRPLLGGLGASLTGHSASEGRTLVCSTGTPRGSGLLLFSPRTSLTSTAQNCILSTQPLLGALRVTVRVTERSRRLCCLLQHQPPRF